MTFPSQLVSRRLYRKALVLFHFSLPLSNNVGCVAFLILVGEVESRSVHPEKPKCNEWSLRSQSFFDSAVNVV